MSRYPGTQFKVYDNSQATAIVPVPNVNTADTVQYLTTFNSVKGPEGITLTSGNNFYDLYGTQDNVDFQKYGQPLFQASMNINNGAAVLAKRAVFDDATLGNTTVSVALTKYRDGKIEVDEDIPSLIKSIKFSKNAKAKYSLAPLMFSIDNSKNHDLANELVTEYKERYDLYKDYIIDVVGNVDTPNPNFLSKAPNITTRALSGYSQSIYYDDNNNIIDINEIGKSKVTNISSITCGLNINQKTFNSNFKIEDIIDNEDGVQKDVEYTQYLRSDSDYDDVYTMLTYKVTADENGKKSGKWVVINKNNKPMNHPTFLDTAKCISSVSRIVSSVEELEAIAKNEWLEDGFISDNPENCIDDTGNIKPGHYEFALFMGEYSIDDDGNVTANTAKKLLDTSNYTNVIRLLNDIMMSRSGYIICEYVFPIFTIFDNGRGESIKSIGIEYDAASSSTLKKAIYSLSVYNYKTSKRLEKFSFSLNPYTRNNNTGYTLDIESAVNYNSSQISVKTYYEIYDALLETLQNILETRSDDIISTYDILFGHSINGKYNAFNSYQISKLINRYTYVYDYAHLDIFDNDIITVNTYCDCDNMTQLDDSIDVRYYYYNYVRTNQKIYEKLEFGSIGYCLARQESKNKKVIPFLIIDDSFNNVRTSKSENNESLLGDTIYRIIEITGQKDGTIINDDLLKPGVVPHNFALAKIVVSQVTKYVLDGGIYKTDETDTNTYYLCPNKKTLDRTDVMVLTGATEEVTTPSTDDYSSEIVYVFGPNADSDANITIEEVYIPLTQEKLYQNQYYRFFSGEFDRDIFNLDIYFPNAVFDANYDNKVKLAIQRLAAYRGDFMCYMDIGINKISSYNDCLDIIPSVSGGLDLTEETSDYYYIRDMHIATTCISYKIRNPYDNKIISVTGTYGLSNLYINHFINDVSKVFAGISNGITINNIIDGTVSYIPKIYPTSEMTSINNIGGVYPSEDETIINEKQLMCDLRVNYGCYYEDRFSIETEYTMNPTESEFSYWNNVALVCLMMQSIRKACPAARYQFITADDLSVYQNAIETAMKPWRNKFAALRFKYVQDEASIENKIFYAAIEVVFRPFAQAEIFELTALNYSTLSSTITNV